MWLVRDPKAALAPRQTIYRVVHVTLPLLTRAKQLQASTLEINSVLKTVQRFIFVLFLPNRVFRCQNELGIVIRSVLVGYFLLLLCILSFTERQDAFLILMMGAGGEHDNCP